ncbi:hypothetical protein [Parachlamydia sp. AcF125]|uniref:hypothetical protein n=1 Tax=Parachlamydia sp. AcF125 TaxID=2795736 RepID=UPI001BC9D758|nr:hypothetical protein [Parachlamydia sp. AcF125]MBS4167746.1 hypothetical protein [Parachlamydia sp. AcF125]
MQLNISLIKNNFLEIYSTLDQGEALEKCLVGSLWGNRIYNTQSGWGKIWRVVYFFAGKRLRDRQLQRAFIKTQQIFDQHVKMIEESAGHYSHYIMQKSLKAPINDNAYLKCRQLLTKWFDATDPFLKQVYNKNPRLQNFFRKQLSPPEEGVSSVFNCKELYLHIKTLQSILDVEELFQGPLPYSIFYKLSHGQEIGEEEKEQLYKWADFLNENKNKMAVRSFHRFLKSLVEEFGRNQASKPSLVKLEMSLVEHRCNFFSQEDPLHLAWRSQLKPGDTIFINGKPFVLGDRIGEKLQGFDRTIHFAIQGDTQKIVTIPVNEAILGIRKSLEADQGYVLKMPTIFEIDATGACAIVERLTTPLNLDWKSQREQFSKEDEDQVGPLATLILWLVKQQISPAYLSPRHLMFNEQGELKTLKLILKTNSFDFNTLQAFVLECAAGNLRVFQHLMEASDLHSHAYARFYEIIVRNTLKENPQPIERLANQYSIVDSLIMERAAKLAQEVRQLRLECMDKIRQASKKNEADLSKLVAREILSQYTRSSAAGVIWPSLAPLIQENVMREAMTARVGHKTNNVQRTLSFN